MNLLDINIRLTELIKDKKNYLRLENVNGLLIKHFTKKITLQFVCSFTNLLDFIFFIFTFKGMVVVTGAVIKEANNADELMQIFETGSASRHIASTKMNAESSRSHLVLSIIIESTNKTSGAVVKGKVRWLMNSGNIAELFILLYCESTSVFGY